MCGSKLPDKESVLCAIQSAQQQAYGEEEQEEVAQGFSLSLS